MQGAPGRGPRGGPVAGTAGPPAKPGSGPGLPPPPHGAPRAHAWGGGWGSPFGPRAGGPLAARGGWQGRFPYPPGPPFGQVPPPGFRHRGRGWGGAPAWAFHAYPGGRGYRQPWGAGRAPGFRRFWGENAGIPSPKELFERADKDKDGKLSLDEFAAGLQRLRSAARSHRAPGPGWPLPARRGGWPGKPPAAAKHLGPSPEALFHRLDANQDGKLSKEEIPERMRAKLDQRDANHDGFLTLEELRQAPQGKAKPAKAEGKPGKKPPAEKQPPSKPAEKKA